MTFQGTFGVHFLPHHAIWDQVTSRELVRIAEQAAAGDVQYVWFSSRFLARDTLTLMGALAAQVPIGLGTRVHHPWGSNPLELASSLATIAELLPINREVLFGIAGGATQSRWVERPRPVRFVRETIGMCRALLAGEEVAVSKYPLVTEYFHLKGTAQMTVQFTRPDAVSFWFPPQGPLGFKLAAELADGIFVSAGTRLGLRALRDGRLEHDVEKLERLRRAAGNPRPLRRILSLEMSLSRDREAAFRRARMHALVASGRQRPADAPELDLTDRGLAEVFLVGTPEDVAEQLMACMEDAERFNCEQIALGVPTGPDPMEAVELTAHVLVPLVKARAGASA
jgi:alkanesulfonate monooxygenase SsuD/methylene tetrahydromethanopterin reductase-like flavin-dependent oxidoreductase (luciferase family)